MKRPLILSAFLSPVLLAASAFLSISLLACTAEPVTGGTNVTVLDGAVFTVTERTVSGGTQLTARGTVKNNGKATWSPTWIVEGQFYSDSTFTFKLGGTTQTFNYSLTKGEQTSWTLKFTSSDYNLADYPRFAVKNLRVTQQ